MQGDKTHPLIFIVGTNNFIEYLQRYQILIFIYLFITNFILNECENDIYTWETKRDKALHHKSSYR